MKYKNQLIEDTDRGISLATFFALLFGVFIGYRLEAILNWLVGG